VQKTLIGSINPMYNHIILTENGEKYEQMFMMIVARHKIRAASAGDFSFVVCFDLIRLSRHLVIY